MARKSFIEKVAEDAARTGKGIGTGTGSVIERLSSAIVKPGIKASKTAVKLLPRR